MKFTDNHNGRIRKSDQSGIMSTIATCIRTVIESVFVHNDDVYYTTGNYMLQKILPNGNVNTIAGIKNADFMEKTCWPLNVNSIFQREYLWIQIHRFTLLIIIVLGELIKME